MRENKRENRFSRQKTSNIIMGLHPIMEAINSGVTIDKIIVQRGLKGELIDELMTLIKEHRYGYSYVPIQKLNRITRKNHQGVIAFISPIDFPSLNNVVINLFEQGINPKLLLLDGVSDVRNFGAIARSAECFGFHAIIIPFHGAAQVNEDAVKTSAGALLKINICKANNLPHTIEFLKDSGIHIVGVSEKSEKNVSQIKTDHPVCLIMGAEDVGISKEIVTKCDTLVKIPMQGSIQSLNVSVSAGIVMYEFCR